MAPKVTHVVNPMLTPPMDLDHIPLADRDYNIAETQCEFDLLKLHCWLRDNYLDQFDEINLWKSRLPLLVFPSPIIFPNSFQNAKPLTFQVGGLLFIQMVKFSSPS